MFSWDGVEQDEWEDTDFLKECEEKGVTIDLKDSDAKAIELKFDSGEKHGRDVKLLRKAEFVSSSIIIVGPRRAFDREPKALQNRSR